jgi:hypothetical protein
MGLETLLVDLRIGNSRWFTGTPARSNNEQMTIADRLTDADVLWASGRREGALLSVLVAVAAASREEWPDVKDDKMRFCRFLSRRTSGSVKVTRGGKSVT